MQISRPATISIILFEGFELLDVFGPAEVFSHTPGLSQQFLSPDGQPVASSQGVQVIPDGAYASHEGDTILIPGGAGTRSLVNDPGFLEQLKTLVESSNIVCSVCTGSALLAATGALDGYSATSNKSAWEWASSFGADINWQKSARWVHDRDRWTSSGVAAGTDMAVAFVAKFFGHGTAHKVAHDIELTVNEDPSNDPFAKEPTSSS